MGALIALCGGIRGTAFAVVATLALLLAGTQTVRLSYAHTQLAKVSERAALAEAAHARAATEASELARLREHELATRADAIGRAYERGKDDARKAGERVAADLRTGNRRLRDEIIALAARGVPGDPAAAGELGDAAQRGAALVGAAVAVGADCDARTQALIEAYESARGLHASRPGD